MTTTTDTLSKLNKAMRESATGPLFICKEVQALVENWDKEDCDGMPAKKAIKKYLGHGPSYFARRARAVDELGDDIRNWMSPGLAVYMTNRTFPAHLRQVAKQRLLTQFATRRHCGHVVDMTHARATLYDVMGYTPKRRTKAETLEQQIVQLRLENQQLRDEIARLTLPQAAE